MTQRYIVRSGDHYLVWEGVGNQYALTLNLFHTVCRQSFDKQAEAQRFIDVAKVAGRSFLYNKELDKVESVKLCDIPLEVVMAQVDIRI